MKIRLVIAALAIGFFGSTVGAQAPKPERGLTLRLPEGVTPDMLADTKEAARVADLLDKEYPAPQPEGVRMLVAILRGSQLNGRDGWFGPADTRYTWDWLAKRCGVDPKTRSVVKKDFPGSAALFDALDRDGDGKITPGDLDWSDQAPYVMQANALNRIFRRIDTSGDGRLSRAELEAFFKIIARDKDHFTADDLRRAMIPRGQLGLGPGDSPSIPVLVRGLFAGELGTISEGPKLNDLAPDFSLKTADGKETVKLSKLIGPKPVVLVFGNFTCGPFRALFPDLDAIRARYKDQATFVMVYVREAHPTDGWKMESNARVGVAVKQPTTTEERVEVCVQFRKKLNPGMTVLVDEISDPAGIAYSAMPGRLYVIDTKGKVAFKNGRGPFGFKAGEMEQALVMCLLETEAVRSPK